MKKRPRTISKYASSLNQIELLIKIIGITAKGETDPTKTQTIKCAKNDGLYKYSLSKIRKINPCEKILELH